MGFTLEQSAKFKEAPVNGQMLIYTRQEVMFRKYDDLSEILKIFGDKEVLEMHLFDKNKEYRLVKTRSIQEKYESGYIEAIIQKDAEAETYVETVNTKEGKMKVINMLNYNNTGMLNIDNYRLEMEV